MATFDLTCVGCGVAFTAKSSRAKWHSPACKKRRQRQPETEAETPTPDADPTDTGLVDAVRRELSEADRLNTVHGQMALQLARNMTAVDATGVAGLSKELDRIRALALEGWEPPGVQPQPDPVAEVEVEDEVEAARRRREEKAEAARRAAARKKPRKGGK